MVEQTQGCIDLNVMSWVSQPSPDTDTFIAPGHNLELFIDQYALSSNVGTAASLSTVERDVTEDVTSYGH